jgi:uncharacterized protein
MTRILFWVALAVLVLMAVRSKLRRAQQNLQQPVQPPRQPAAPARAESLPDAEVMLCCAQCGVYYPASETVQAKGRDFCSQAHASFP